MRRSRRHSTQLLGATDWSPLMGELFPLFGLWPTSKAKWRERISFYSQPFVDWEHPLLLHLAKNTKLNVTGTCNALEDFCYVSWSREMGPWSRFRSNITDDVASGSVAVCNPRVVDHDTVLLCKQLRTYHSRHTRPSRGYDSLISHDHSLPHYLCHTFIVKTRRAFPIILRIIWCEIAMLGIMSIRVAQDKENHQKNKPDSQFTGNSFYSSRRMENFSIRVPSSQGIIFSIPLHGKFECSFPALLKY